MTHPISLYEPENDRSLIFRDNNEAINYLISRNHLEVAETCDVCGYSMKFEKSSKHKIGKIYRCLNRNCRKIESLLKGRKIEKPKINLNDYLYAIYKWIENGFEKDVCRNLNIAKGTYQNIKKNINNFLNDQFILEEKLGGKNIKVQVDETVICHGETELFPSQLPDDFPGITWLVGMIEENSSKIKYEIVPNRSLETFKNLFERNINKESIIITDGHASYPGAVDHVRGIHKVVNHSRGFKNEEGFHTNNIENLWSILKYEIKKRRGVISTNIPTFLKEFDFRYKNIRNRNSVNVRAVFEDIIEYLMTYTDE